MSKFNVDTSHSIWLLLVHLVWHFAYEFLFLLWTQVKPDCLADHTIKRYPNISRFIFVITSVIALIQNGWIISVDDNGILRFAEIHYIQDWVSKDTLFIYQQFIPLFPYWVHLFPMPIHWALENSDVSQIGLIHS